MALGPLSPFPQLLPHLDQCLDSSRAGKAVVNQTAILEGAFVELADTVKAQMREVVTKLLKLFFIPDIRFFAARSPGHSKAMLAYSPYIRPHGTASWRFTYRSSNVNLALAQ